MGKCTGLSHLTELTEVPAGCGSMHAYARFRTNKLHKTRNARRNVITISKAHLASLRFSGQHCHPLLLAMIALSTVHLHRQKSTIPFSS